MVWKLQINIQTRVGLAVILSLGLFTSAVARYKTPMQAKFFKETDWSGHGSWYYIWQQVEMNVGIIAANLPTLKPLFANFFDHMRTLTKGRSSGSRSGPLSAPFKSNGYYRQNDSNPGQRGDAEGQSSYAMHDVSSSTASKRKDSYDEIFVLGKESYDLAVEHSRRQSTTRGSEESNLAHEAPLSAHGPLSPSTTGRLTPQTQGLGLGRNLTIPKTTELRVSKSYET